MDVSRSERWMEDTLQHINNQIHHKYLHDAIGAPVIDEDRLSMLLFPFHISGKYSELDQSYVSTATLIQTALDTHEKVSNKQDDSLRIRQLTVLAGDFYSGLYYRILARIPDVKLIRSIAHAIQEINEHKIDLTSRSLLTVEDIIFSLTKIESAIVAQLFNHIGFERYIPLAEDLLVLNRLQREKEFFASRKFSILFSNLDRVLPKTSSSLYREKQLLDSHLELVFEMKQKIMRKLKDLDIPFNFIRGSIFSHLESITERPKIYAEEG